MVEIAGSAAITYLIAVLVTTVLLRGLLPLPLIKWTLLSIAAGVALASVNLELALFAQKDASTFAFDVYSGRTIPGSGSFLPLALVAYPSFAIFGEWWAVIGVNVALVAIAVGHARRFGRRPALLLVTAPAVVNFAMFALRDPLIGVALFIVTLRLGSSAARPKLPLYSAALVGLYVMRPECLAIFVVARVVQLRHRLRKDSWLIGLAPPALALGLVGLLFIPQTLGLERSSSVAEVPSDVDRFFDSRATRYSADDGGGSNILGGRLASWPLPIRYPLQVVTFFILPLPFEIRNLTLALAALDSIVFVRAMRLVWPQATPAQRTLLVSYVLAVTFFASNYGNLFRLRMPAYFILAGIAANQPFEPSRLRLDGRSSGIGRPRIDQ